MKYKAGDRVRVKEGLIVGRDYGNLYFPPSIGEYRGKTYTIKNIDGDGDAYLDSSGYAFSDEMLEPAPFGKSGLKTGMRVRYRNGEERIVLKNDDEMVFTSFDGVHTSERDYKEDLTHRIGFAEFDIMEVLKPRALHQALEQDCELISIWKCEEEPIEITIEEIAELKGVSPERIRIKKAE